MITKEQVENAQKAWGDGLVKIGSLKCQHSECERFANEFIDTLYAFDSGIVLFKPTKASVIQFRPTKKGALSYMIGGDKDFPEDHGFAFRGWKKVRFENAHIVLEENRAIVMGNYFFTDHDGNETKVEFTFGYKMFGNNLKIDLHHSSIPYKPEI